MASKEGRSASSLFEGWEKWQIAVAVGAPVCLGLAGLWYYNRSQRKPPPSRKTGKSSQESGQQNSGVTANENKVSETQPKTEETPLEQAQAAKNKGNNYFKSGHYDEAIKCYTQALEVCPPENQQEISTFYANRAAAYEKLKNPKRVIENCTEAIKINGKYTKALWRRAAASETVGDLVTALEDATAVCILEGFQNQPTLQMADRVLQSLGKQKAAEAMLTKSKDLPSKHFMKSYFGSFLNDPVQQSFLPGQRMEGAGDGKPSEQQKSEANNVDTQVQSKEENGEDEKVEDNQPEQVPETQQMNGEAENHIPENCPYKMAVEKLRAESYGELISLCTEEIDVSPSSDYRLLALLLRGTMYSISAQQDKAEIDFNEILAVEELDKQIKVNALIKRGSLYISQEKQTDGLADFAQAVRVDQGNSDIYHHRGRQNIQLNRLDDAIKDFENSITKNRDSPISYVQKSYAEHRRAAKDQSTMKLEKSIQSYEETLAKFPQCADGHALYAQALCDLGRFDDADNEFETAIRLEPENASTYVHKAVLRLQWKQNLEEPVELIQKAISMDDKCEYAYEIMGTIEVQRADMGKAVALFEKAIDLCRTKEEMSHLFSLLHAAKAQLRAVQILGMPLPGQPVKV